MPVERTRVGSVWRRVAAPARRVDERLQPAPVRNTLFESVRPAPFVEHGVSERRGNALDVRAGRGVLVPSPSADFRGPLFVGAPSPRDVEQGKLGDCYLLSSLSAIAAVHPEWITEAVTPADGDDDTRGVAVRFFDEKTRREARVVVDRRLAVRSDGARRRRGWPRYARGRPPGDRARMVSWGPLVEKAYAAWKGGYEAMGHGGSPARALTELTGRRAVVVERARGAHAMRRALLDAWDAQMPIVVSSLRKSRAADLMGTGVRANHAYAVLGVREEEGELVVTLRNPWGHFEPGSSELDDRFDGVDDGVFDLRFDEFLRYFRKITTLEGD